MRNHQNVKQKRRCYILIILLHVCVFALFFRPTLFGDGYFYYYWGHSLAFDHDVNMFNQYVQTIGSMGKPPLNEQGYLPNLFPMGQGLFSYPAFLLAKAANFVYPSFKQTSMISPELGFFPCFAFDGTIENEIQNSIFRCR